MIVILVAIQIVFAIVLLAVAMKVGGGTVGFIHGLWQTVPGIVLCTVSVVLYEEFNIGMWTSLPGLGYMIWTAVRPWSSGDSKVIRQQMGLEREGAPPVRITAQVERLEPWREGPEQAVVFVAVDDKANKALVLRSNFGGPYDIVAIEGTTWTLRNAKTVVSLRSEELMKLVP